jgi:hypothetical protein
MNYTSVLGILIPKAPTDDTKYFCFQIYTNTPNKNKATLHEILYTFLLFLMWKKFLIPSAENFTRFSAKARDFLFS